MLAESNFVSVSQLLVGNLTYVLLILSMLMVRMLWLRIFATAAGTVGAVYAWFWLHDPISTTWEIMFTLVNVAQISLASYRNAIASFSPEEEAFYHSVVPSLEPHQVRRLLRIAQWRQSGPGTRLTEQGVVAPHFIYIRSGQVSILYDGKVVGSCGPGKLIGEISVAAGEPATATAVTTDTVHYLAIERTALQKLRKSAPDVWQAIDHCVRRNLQDKLVQMNAAASAQH
jgi:CRP-like cAMP-binding protein